MPSPVSASAGRPETPEQATTRRVWGLTPAGLHDGYWAACGMQVVRPGGAADSAEDARLFLLLDGASLVLFPLRSLLGRLSWLDPRLFCVRLRQESGTGYQVREIEGAGARTTIFMTGGNPLPTGGVRVGLTRHRDVAMRWQTGVEGRSGWRSLRRAIPRRRRAVGTQEAAIYRRGVDEDQLQLVARLAARWKRPDQEIERAARVSGGAWVDSATRLERVPKSEMPVWCGVGRADFPDGAPGAAAAVLWDLPGVEGLNASVRPTGSSALDGSRPSTKGGTP